MPIQRYQGFNTSVYVMLMRWLSWDPQCCICSRPNKLFLTAVLLSPASSSLVIRIRIRIPLFFRKQGNFFASQRTLRLQKTVIIVKINNIIKRYSNMLRPQCCGCVCVVFSFTHSGDILPLLPVSVWIAHLSLLATTDRVVQRCWGCQWYAGAREPDGQSYSLQGFL